MAKTLSTLRSFIVLLIVGATLALVLPPSHETLQALHINATQYRVAIFTLILPYAVIWFSAFYAFSRLRQYAMLVRKTPEGEGFRDIARGVGVLAWGLALPTILSMLMGAVAQHLPGFKPVQTIINNYLAVLVPLVGFSIIGRGTRKLNDLVGARPGQRTIRLVIAIFLAVAALFIHSVLHNQNAHDNPYYLDIYLLLLTLIVPYLYTWAIGLLSGLEAALYAKYIKGVLYRRAMTALGGGMAIVIVASVATQYLTASFASKATTSLGFLLALLYMLLAIQAVGYVFIAIGAKQLKKMEEV